MVGSKTSRFAMFGISITTAGFFTMTWGIGPILGGLAGGRLTDRLGQRRALVYALLVSLASILALAVIFNPVVAWPLVFLFGLAFGYYETVYFAISMKATDPRIAASMFSILMAIANVGTGIGRAAGGSLVDAVGYRLTFAVIAGMNLLAIPLLSVIFKKSPVQQAAASTVTTGR